MIVRTFSKEEILIQEGEQMEGIILMRTGIVNVVTSVSLLDEYLLQELYPKCSYGSYAFFASEDSDNKKSKFTLMA